MTKLDFTIRKLEFPTDCQRIQAVLLTSGYVVSLEQAEGLWSTYSNDRDAGWLCLPSQDKDLLPILVELIEDLCNITMG